MLGTMIQHLSTKQLIFNINMTNDCISNEDIKSQNKDYQTSSKTYQRKLRCPRKNR